MAPASSRSKDSSKPSRPLGTLHIIALSSEVAPTDNHTISRTAALSAISPNNLHRTISRGSNSSSSSSEGPRLGGIYKRLAVGTCAPAIIAASIASPYASAGMNRHCTIGDELSNLGRVSIITSTPRSLQANPSASNWLQLNQPSSTRKSNDPRPRKVNTDLIISTFIAMLAG